MKALLALAAMLLIGAGPASVTLVEQPDASADLIGTEVLLQAGLDRQTQDQNGLAALVAEIVLLTPVTGGETLQDAVTADGGSITYAMEPRHVRFYLEGVSAGYPGMLSLMHAALVKPDFSQATVDAAREALDRKIARNEKLALSVGIDMLNRAFYQQSAAGMPPYGIPQTLAGFAPSAAQAFYASHYRRGDAVVSAIGNIASAPGLTPAAVLDGLPAGTSSASKMTAANLPATSRELIAHRDVPVPWLIAQYKAPDISSKDFGAMLILSAFMQRTLSDVSEAPGIATRSAAQRGVGAYYNFDAQPANVIIYVDGGLGDPTRTFATALTVVNVLGHAKLDGDLTQMKAFAAGRFLEDTQTLQDRAWLAAVFASRGMQGDYVAKLLRAVDSTTSADLQRVSLKYLGSPAIALVLPRSQAVQAP